MCTAHIMFTMLHPVSAGWKTLSAQEGRRFGDSEVDFCEEAQNFLVGSKVMTKSGDRLSSRSAQIDRK